MASSKDWLKEWSSESRLNFQRNHRIKSFEEYILDLQSFPYSLSRNAVQYLVDMLEHFGESRAYSSGTLFKQFNLFTREFAGAGARRIVGHEAVVMEIYSALKNFVIEGSADRIIHLHGPSCSGKSLIVEWLMRGIEEFSRKKEGSLYTFHWVFPMEGGKRMGFGEKSSGAPAPTAYAHLSSDQVSFRLGCDLNDSPLLLIPPKRRLSFLEELLKEAPEEEKTKFLPTKHVLESELCGRCRSIFDALHDEYGGDVEKVLSHVQVRRLYISRKYQRGAVVISPQETPDAGSRLLSTDSNWDAIPSALQHLTLEQLGGTLINSNNGIVEFSDFLTRPPELNKYLLSAVDRGGIEVSQNSASLNLVIFATSNEENLDGFKQTPDFPPFKGRMMFVPVPYLLERTKEARVHYENFRKISQFKHISPYLGEASGLWSVLTRLLKPQPDNYPKDLKEAVAAITPYEKAVMYDSFNLFAPGMTSFDMRKMELLPFLRDEFRDTQFYEGRFGFSPRDLAELFYDQAYNEDNNCIGLFDLLEGLGSLAKDQSLFKFLQLKPDQGYNDVSHFHGLVREEYLRLFEYDVLAVLGVYPKGGPFAMARAYFASLLQDAKLEGDLPSFEKQLAGDRKPEAFRDQTKKKMDESLRISDWGFIPLFVEEVAALEKRRRKSRQASTRKLLENAIGLLVGGENNIPAASLGETRKFVETMIESSGYCPNCLYENVRALLESRYG